MGPVQQQEPAAAPEEVSQRAVQVAVVNDPQGSKDSLTASVEHNEPPADKTSKTGEQAPSAALNEEDANNTEESNADAKSVAAELKNTDESSPDADSKQADEESASGSDDSSSDGGKLSSGSVQSKSGLSTWLKWATAVVAIPSM